jgi:F420-dependent oxidoreductase-like protein
MATETQPTSTMRLGVAINYGIDFREAVDEIIEYERAGIDVVSVAEAYSFDAVSQLGYLAAVTDHVVLASGILPIYSRTPALLAMTAAGLDAISGGRFELGIGASGPQVIEGFHGVPFTAPLGRTKEIIEICRAVWRREKVDYQGKYYQVPLPAGSGTGLGKPLKIINTPVRERIPISVAAITPKSVTQVAEIADGWLPIFFHPELAERAWGEALTEGTARRDPELGPLSVETGVPLYIGDNVDAALDAFRAQLALYVGGMGARGANFYNSLATSYGFGDAAATVQELYLTGRKAEAAAAVPDELVRAVSLIGDEAHVRQRLNAFARAGVTTLSLEPLARTRAERVESIEAVRSLRESGG